MVWFIYLYGYTYLPDSSNETIETALAADAYFTFIARIHQVHIPISVFIFQSFAPTVWAETAFNTIFRSFKRNTVQHEMEKQTPILSKVHIFV